MNKSDPAATIAYQGESGAFSEEAILSSLGADVRPVPMPAFRDVSKAVAEGRCDFGMLPVENTLAGSVDAALDALIDDGLQPIGEVVLPIRHCLLGVPGSTVEGLTRVISHPVALAQCTRFFQRNPHIEAVAVHDTAGAARLVSEEGSPAVAAIASVAAAAGRGLDIIEPDLQDRDDNQTRFLLVQRAGRPLPVHSGEGTGFKSLLVFETEDRAGALADVLNTLSAQGVDLCRLESRPGRTPWSYRFVAEARARLDGDVGEGLLQALRPLVLRLDLRGPYSPLQPGESMAATDDSDAARLSVIRNEIDLTDQRLIVLLGERRRLASSAQGIRAGAGRPGFDPPREAEVLKRAARAAREMGLPEEAVRDVYWRVMALCAPEVTVIEPKSEKTA